MKNDKNKWFLLMVVFLVVLTLFGGTLAYWRWITSEEQQTNVVFTVTQDFKCSADGGGNISNGDKYLVPSDCTNSEYAIQRTISVNTELFTEGQNVSMDLWLNVNMNNTDNELINSDYFKYALTTSPNSCTNGVISSGSFKNDMNSDKNVLLLDSKSYSRTSSELYYLYIWLDNAETDSSTMDKDFDMSLGGECTNYVMDTDLMYNVNNLSNNNDNLDTSFYTLSNYTCENGSTLTYDPYSRKLTTSNIDKCDLNFTKQSSNPKLYDVVEIGDYISYKGNNGCTGNQCFGWNANQTDTDIYDNFGYCGSEKLKFNIYGWRVLHKTDNSVYIVSAGSPECVKKNSSSSITNIQTLNMTTLNYCNTLYMSDGICDDTTVHAFNGDDFYKFTSQYYGSENTRYLYSYNDGGTYGESYCYGKHSNHYCGYNNSLIDNGGYYSFGSAYNSSYTLIWTPENRYIYYNYANAATEMTIGLSLLNGMSEFGVRPVLKLDVSILATGGAGTMENPYTISERSDS